MYAESAARIRTRLSNESIIGQQIIQLHAHERSIILPHPTSLLQPLVKTSINPVFQILPLAFLKHVTVRAQSCLGGGGGVSTNPDARQRTSWRNGTPDESRDNSNAVCHSHVGLRRCRNVRARLR